MIKWTKKDVIEAFNKAMSIPVEKPPLGELLSQLKPPASPKPTLPKPTIPRTMSEETPTKTVTGIM